MTSVQFFSLSKNHSTLAQIHLVSHFDNCIWQVSPEEGAQLGSEHNAMFREVSVSESPVDLCEILNMAVIESLPSSEFLTQASSLEEWVPSQAGCHRRGILRGGRVFLGSVNKVDRTMQKQLNAKLNV